MDTPVTILISAQTMALVGLAFRLGRYAQRFEQNEQRINDLETAKTDVTLATFGEKVSGLQTAMERVRVELDDFRGLLIRHFAAAGGD